MNVLYVSDFPLLRKETGGAGKRLDYFIKSTFCVAEYEPPDILIKYTPEPTGMLLSVTPFQTIV